MTVTRDHGDYAPGRAPCGCIFEQGPGGVLLARRSLGAGENGHLGAAEPATDCAETVLQDA